MDPITFLFLKELMFRLIMLMALPEADKVQTLQLLTVRNITINKGSFLVWLGSNIKECQPKFTVQVVKFHVYVQYARLCDLSFSSNLMRMSPRTLARWMRKILGIY